MPGFGPGLGQRTVEKVQCGDRIAVKQVAVGAVEEGVHRFVRADMVVGTLMNGAGRQCVMDGHGRLRESTS